MSQVSLTARRTQELATLPPSLVSLTAPTSSRRDRDHAYIHRSTLPPFLERSFTNISSSSTLRPRCTRPRSQPRVLHLQRLSSIPNTVSQSNSPAPLLRAQRRQTTMLSNSNSNSTSTTSQSIPTDRHRNNNKTTLYLAQRIIVPLMTTKIRLDPLLHIGQQPSPTSPTWTLFSPDWRNGTSVTNQCTSWIPWQLSSL